MCKSEKTLLIKNKTIISLVKFYEFNQFLSRVQFSHKTLRFSFNTVTFWLLTL